MTLTFKQKGDLNGKAEFIVNFVATGTTSDSTTTITSNVISNMDFRIDAMNATLICTGGGTTSSNLTLTFQGSHDATNWTTVGGGAGTAMASSATDTSTASTTTVLINIDSDAYAKKSFAFPYLRYKIASAGSTPNFIGSLSLGIRRAAY